MKLLSNIVVFALVVGFAIYFFPAVALVLAGIGLFLKETWGGLLMIVLAVVLVPLLSYLVYWGNKDQNRLQIYITKLLMLFLLVGLLGLFSTVLYSIFVEKIDGFYIYMFALIAIIGTVPIYKIETDID